MKSLLVLFLACVLFAPAAFASLTNADVEVLHKFNAFETKFNKLYAAPSERFYRLSVFAENVERIKKLNEEHGTPVFGVTKFMDLTPEEFKTKYLTLELPQELPQAPMAEAPQAAVNVTAWDWRHNKTGVVTPVKNQLQCGSCWAFSATESIESAWALAGNQLQELAPQQIVDCDIHGINQGCNGGWPHEAYNYVIEAGGMVTEASYPYKQVQGSCKYQPSEAVASINSWKWVSRSAFTENTNMLNYVANVGPVSVCVDAGPWQYYIGGVLKRCSSSINHAVQATGFEVRDNTNVWNVRNSWGADWGENGYISLERGSNLCQIATIVSAATA